MAEAPPAARGLVMGVLNVTPDSFSDGGRFADPQAAIAHGLAMVADGADVVDVGGESSRPGADPVPEAEERRRVVPVVEALAPHVRVSVDTVKPAVAEAAVAAGATLINDISSSLHGVAASLGVGWVAMHMQGDPRTMQQAPTYDDVVAEVVDHLARCVTIAEEAGVDEVWVDPGIGFGKSLAHNLSLLRHLDRIVAIGRPVLVGTSRKSSLGRLLADSDGVGEPVPADDRLEASVATATWALAAGASMVRVHDVLPTVQAALVVGRPPAVAGSAGR
ncbi:MAG: dihydropteroate synthase [Acidimicrobiales bacterium]